MPPPTFSPPRPPQPGTGESTTPRVLRAAFGDGYESVAGDGLNTLLADPVTLSWGVLSAAEAETIVTFMEDRAGTEAFLYTLPGQSTPRQFRVVSWNRTDGPRHDSLSVALREVADL